MSDHSTRPATFRVTLSRVDSGKEEVDDLRERKLILTPDKPILIGRASKNHQKHLLAAKDNAWINSPVISRNHAQISTSLRSGRARVYIRDNGSMHGTMVNADHIGKGTDFVIKDGDLIRFGTVVVRDNESFTPPEFSIRCEKLPPWSTEATTHPQVIDLTQSDVQPKRYVVPSDSESSDRELEPVQRPKIGTKKLPAIGNTESRPSDAPKPPSDPTAVGDKPKSDGKYAPNDVIREDSVGIAEDFGDAPDDGYRDASIIVEEPESSKAVEETKKPSALPTRKSEGGDEDNSHYTDSENVSDEYQSDMEGSSVSDDYPEEDDQSISASSEVKDFFIYSPIASSNSSDDGNDEEERIPGHSLAIQDLVHSSETELSSARPTVASIVDGSSTATETAAKNQEKFPKMGGTYKLSGFTFGQERADTIKQPVGINGRPTALPEYDDWSSWVPPPPPPEQNPKTTGYGNETQKFLNPLPDYFGASDGAIPKYHEGPFSLSKNDPYPPPPSFGYATEFRSDCSFGRASVTRTAHLPPPPMPMGQPMMAPNYDIFPPTSPYEVHNDRPPILPSNSLYGGADPLAQVAVPPYQTEMLESPKEPARPKAVLSIPDIVECVNTSNVEAEGSSAPTKKRKADEISEDISVPPTDITAADLPTPASSAMDAELSENVSDVIPTCQQTAEQEVLASQKITPPRKRTKLHYAATVLGSAILGGVAAVVGLAALPESYFQ